MEIEGSAAVIEWFGRWPDFHDDEVVAVELWRHDTSRLHIHALSYGPAKDAMVTFSFRDIVALTLTAEDFHRQNVIFNLDIRTADATTTVEWSSSYGVAGRIEAKHVSVSVERISEHGK